VTRACLALTLLFAPVPLAAQTAESVKAAVASITSADILHRIGVIADDSMRGRQTPSPELEKTASFIAGEFQQFGLKPAGDSGRFLQRYPLRQGGLDTATSSVSISGGPTFRFGRDVLPATSAQADASGKMVILSGGKPDAQGLAALDLEGAVVLVLLPADDPLGRNHPMVQNLGIIAGQQPAAVVLVTPAPDPQWQATVRAIMTPRPSPGWKGSEASAPGGRPIVAIREPAIRKVLQDRGVDVATLQKVKSGAPRVTPVEETLSVTMKPAGEGYASSAPNVVAILEGSDPVLRNEYIVFSGHMDHVGVGQPNQKGDSIYNGADDDASGTIAVVEMAEAFAKLNPRPKRSLIFLTVSGEERGLWGSEYFADHSPVPISQIVADLNTDMVGRNWKDTIVAIGKEHSDLGATLNRVNRQHPELRMTAIDDLWPQESFYTRSDHYNFARKGVPILFFFNGVHDDYHQPGDEVSKIDAEKEARIVKLVFYLGLELANAKDKPKWNPESYRKVVEPVP
jgi:hypothetical protein